MCKISTRLSSHLTWTVLVPVPGGHNQEGCVHVTDFDYFARPIPLPSATAAEAGCARRRSSFALQKRWNPEDQSGISRCWRHAGWGWALASQDLATRCSPCQTLSTSCRHPLSRQQNYDYLQLLQCCGSSPAPCKAEESHLCNTIQGGQGLRWLLQ